MTKEELEKEAEELIQRFEMANSMNCFMQLTPDRKQMGEMLVMIAEPREKRIADLEKENAELKAKLKPENCLKLLAKGGYVKFTNDKLTKAKEFLNEFMRISKASDEDFDHDYSELITEAEQFLKEVTE